MGSLRFEGVRFAVFSDDHLPPHVHGAYAEVRVVVELVGPSQVSACMREGSLVPPNAKRADVRHILRVARDHHAALLSLWEERHG
jgi:hypothetical protein